MGVGYAAAAAEMACVYVEMFAEIPGTANALLTVAIWLRGEAAVHFKWGTPCARVREFADLTDLLNEADELVDAAEEAEVTAERVKEERRLARGRGVSRRARRRRGGNIREPGSKSRPALRRRGNIREPGYKSRPAEQRTQGWWSAR